MTSISVIATVTNTGGAGATASASIVIEDSAVQNTMTIIDRSGVASVNYPLQFGRVFVDGEIPNYPQLLVNGSPVATQADVKNRWPDGSVRFAVIAAMVAIPANGTLTLGFQDQPSGSNMPLTQAQMLDVGYDFDARIDLAFTGGATGSASARAMLDAGDYKLWTSGQIAQTIELADDTIARKYDIGNGDGFRPFRPRFYATFWPQTGQVSVRFVGENGLTTELEDLAYVVRLMLGNAMPATVYTYDLTGTQATFPKKHWAKSWWTKTFWLGGAPEARINIDHNLAYLASTKAIPNFDTSFTIPEATLVTEYAKWTTRPHDWFDGNYNGGIWTVYMGTGGSRSEIAPYPGWTTQWLYSGDWRMREFALGMADLAASWPANLRETDPTRRFLRTDPLGSPTGLGRALSLSGRPKFHGGDPINTGVPVADQVKVVGPVAGLFSTPSRQWSFGDAHLPQPFYPQYLLTGDPFYLAMMYFWGAISAANVGPSARGPTGAEGAINFDVALRADAWVARSRAELIYITPDDAPEKTYFAALLDDALARWEGGFGITGTVYDGHPMKAWGVLKKNFHTSRSSNGAVAGLVPPMKNWESAEMGDGAPAYDFALVGGETPPWQQWYLQYALGRVAELGFPAGPVRDFSGLFPISMILESGQPWLINDYLMPVVRKIAMGGGFFANWSEIIAAITPAYLLTLPNKYAGARDAYSNYIVPGISYLVDAGAPGAAQAWAWLKPNVYDVVDYSPDPRWAILPRTGA